MIGGGGVGGGIWLAFGDHIGGLTVIFKMSTSQEFFFDKAPRKVGILSLLTSLPFLDINIILPAPT